MGTLPEVARSGGKAKKARKIGTEILSEDAFFELLAKTTAE